jgi:CO/xanthine dehydrogenase Mo-binding subunit
MTTRRAFLQSAAAITVAWSPLASATPLAPAPLPKSLQQWLALRQDGSLLFRTGKVDLGTGVATALRQLIAGELDAPFDSVVLLCGDTASVPDQGPTWGSTTLSQGGTDLRHAAATLRRALLGRGVALLEAPAETLELRDGIIRAPSGRSVTFAQAAAGVSLDLAIDRTLPLRPVSALRIAGTSVPRPDVAAKVTGQFRFIQDVEVPGMLHGRVLHPPKLGARVRSVDDRAARAIDPRVQVVRVGDLVGVVAPDEWLAVRARASLKVEWTGGKPLPTVAEVHAALRATPASKVQVVASTGDVEAAKRTARRVAAASYRFPYQSHGSIGPSCGVADVRPDGITLWSAGQAPHWLRDTVAAAMSLPPDKVRVVYVEGSGCYGRNGHEDAVADALMLSRAVGRPVRVQWMREDEHTASPRGPAHLVELEGGVSPDGRIAFLCSDAWVAQLPARLPPVAMPALAEAGLAQDMDVFAGNTLGNFAPSYPIAALALTAHHLNDMPVRVSWIRGPGRVQNVFANEGFMDELAGLAGADPAEFRLRHVEDPRGRAVIERVLRLSGWHTGMPSAADTRPRGRGIAYCRYSNATVYVAMVAQVAVDRASGAVSLEHVWVSHDCGFLVNPDGVLNQVQGQVIQGASRALLEEVRWEDGKEVSRDWASYPILRHEAIPRIEVDLVPGTDPPWGAGEPATAVVPAAIANAIHAACGARLREAPFTPARVLSALATSVRRKENA